MEFKNKMKSILPVIPYSQRDNTDDPSTKQNEKYVTCNVTSLATCLSAFGIKINPMEIFKLCNSPVYVEYAQKLHLEKFIENKKLAQVWLILEKAANEILMNNHLKIKARWGYFTFVDFVNKIDDGCPSMVGGLFTHGGHIVPITGYDGIGFDVCDPWGDWRTNYTEQNGAHVAYFYDKMREILSKNDQGNFLGLIFDRH